MVNESDRSRRTNPSRRSRLSSPEGTSVTRSRSFRSFSPPSCTLPAQSLANNTANPSCSRTWTPAHFFNSLYGQTLREKRTIAFFAAITLTQFLMNGWDPRPETRYMMNCMLPMLILGSLSSGNAANASPGLEPVHIHQVSPF